MGEKQIKRIVILLTENYSIARLVLHLLHIIGNETLIIEFFPDMSLAL